MAIKTKMTKLQIIRQIADFYNRNPSLRAVKNGICFYYKIINKKPCKCAVGRCLINPQKIQSEFGDKTLLSGCSHIWDSIEEMDKDLKVKYRGHSIRFWIDIQVLHDEVQYWCEDGLTETGKEYLNGLLVKYRTKKLKQKRSKK